MKEVWQTKKLGELCEIELGRTPLRANSTFWDVKRETNNVWLSIADLLSVEDGVVVDSKEYVSDKGAKICKLVQNGTLLVSFKLTLGRLAFAGRDLFTNEAIAALTIFNERELSKKFLFYFLHFFDWVKAAQDDVKLKGMTLNKAKLGEIKVHFPESLPEQRRIVRILDYAFDGIATAKANTEKNLGNARALFESHLQFVFTQRGPGWMEKSVAELLAEGALVKPFDGNHGEIHPTRADYTESGVPFVMACDLQNGQVDTVHCKFISRKLADSLRVGFASHHDSQRRETENGSRRSSASSSIGCRATGAALARDCKRLAASYDARDTAGGSALSQLPRRYRVRVPGAMREHGNLYR